MSDPVHPPHLLLLVPVQLRFASLPRLDDAHELQAAVTTATNMPIMATNTQPRESTMREAGGRNVTNYTLDFDQNRQVMKRKMICGIHLICRVFFSSNQLTKFYVSFLPKTCAAANKT